MCGYSDRQTHCDLCNNKSIVTNASVPVLILNKGHNVICYHRVNEARAVIQIRKGCIPGDLNLKHLLTKTTMVVNVKDCFVRKLFHNNVIVIEMNKKATKVV